MKIQRLAFGIRCFVALQEPDLRFSDFFLAAMAELAFQPLPSNAIAQLGLDCHGLVVAVRLEGSNPKSTVLQRAEKSKALRMAGFSGWCLWRCLCIECIGLLIVFLLIL